MSGKDRGLTTTANIDSVINGPLISKLMSEIQAIQLFQQISARNKSNVNYAMSWVIYCSYTPLTHCFNMACFQVQSKIRKDQMGSLRKAEKGCSRRCSIYTQTRTHQVEHEWEKKKIHSIKQMQPISSFFYRLTKTYQIYLRANDLLSCYQRRGHIRRYKPHFVKWDWNLIPRGKVTL